MLEQALRFQVRANQMPSMIIILSDMEFDQCADDIDMTAYEMIKSKYTAAGYEIPRIAFWNLASRNKNVPVSYTTSGTALVSGFSPSIMTALLKSEDFTPKGVMMSKINEERYSMVTI
jgi:hypothetical protein